MRFSRRLGVMVAFIALGLIAMAGIALHELRSSMVEGRRDEIHTVLMVAANQVAYYQSLERDGKLTREEAQARAIEAMNALRDGKSTYVWARDSAALGLVQGNPDNVGKVNVGAKLADGRTEFQHYLDALSTDSYAYFDQMVNKSGSSGQVPKIIGVTKVKGWDWIVGFGIYLDDIDAAFWSMAWRFITVGLLILSIVVGLAYAMARSMYRRLGGEPAYAAEVASTIASGDLSQKLDARFGAGSMLESVAGMQSSLRTMIDDIKQGATQLGRSASDLTSLIKNIHDASNQSSEATSSTAAAIEELAVSIDHISSSARETEISSSKSSALAAEGERMVRQAAETIQSVSDKVSESSTLIEGLRDRSRQIDSIASAIKEIADQTNLLALNAAIEAARAGEQGRGFAVVADEVRKLAERTTLATDQITHMIGAVQADTTLVVQSMQSVLPLVTQGVEMANSAAAALHDINQGVATTLGNIREVANATAEQSTASGSVAQNVERITEMVYQSSTSLQEANNNVQKLESLAGIMRNSVARFKL